MVQYILEEIKMRDRRAYIVSQAIAYIEENLQGRPELGKVADALHYSKFHLHRMFTETVGMTPHEYAVRRRLTEAAGRLVFSGETVMEIALLSGYGSQQAFTDAFRAMYKTAPGKFRAAGRFYPLQLEMLLDGEPAAGGFQKEDIARAGSSDAEDWMELVRLNIDGYPCFDEAEYMENLCRYMEEGRALILRCGAGAAGILGFSKATYGGGSIDFLAVHPQYRHLGVAELFLGKLASDIFPGGEISVTTYRAGDRADTGYREMYRRLGFKERELLWEYGYPTQRFVFLPG